MKKESKEEILDELITDEDMEDEVVDEDAVEEKSKTSKTAGKVSPFTYPEAARILETSESFSDVEHFEGVSASELDMLINEGLMDPHGSQNNSPSAMKFNDFMRSHPGFTAHGYVVSPLRDDYRITIEGLYFRGSADDKLKEEFVDFANGADELKVEDDRLRCWWD